MDARRGDSPWWATRGVGPAVTPEQNRAAYLGLVTIHHPDKGGDRRRFERVGRACAAGKAARRPG